MNVITRESHKSRVRWAKAIDRTITQAGTRTFGPYTAPLAHPVVVKAAAPALLGVADALRDDRPVSNEAIEELRVFMTRGASSPLYGRSPGDARAAAERLRERFDEAA